MALATTVWFQRSGNGEYTSGAIYEIADSADDLLVDPAGDNIVDTGSIYNAVPITVWQQNEGT